MTELEHLWPDPDRRDHALLWVAGDVEAYEPRTRLEPAEIRALQASASGLSAEDAAVVLGTTLYTVRDQLKRARRALRAKNTTHACCEALRQGVIR